jgi:hypothetical protein
MLFNKQILGFYLIFLFYFTGALGQQLANRVVRPRGPVNQTCLNYLNNNNKQENYLEKCNFMKCFEKRFSCGPNYWIINWGYKYCVKYADEEFRAKITSKGIEMFNEMNVCMAKKLESYYVSDKALNCKNLYRMAFKFQTQCYIDMGENFCEGFRENGSEMMKIIDKRDILNGYSMRMIKKATSICKPDINLMELFSFRFM